MSDKTKEQFLAEAFHPVQGIETGNLLKALQAYADQEKRKEAIYFFTWGKSCKKKALEELRLTENPSKVEFVKIVQITDEELYDLYLQHIALVNKNKK